MSRVLAAVLFAALAGGCAESSEERLAGGGPEALASLSVRAEAPTDTTAEARTAFLADGAGGTWFDALAGDVPEALAGAVGYRVAGQPALDGWHWWLDADSLALTPDARTHGLARPDLVVRAYAQADTTTGFFARLARSVLARVRGTTPGGTLAERVTLLDGTDGRPGALVVEVADSVGTVGFRPLVADRAVSDAYRVERVGDVLLIARADQVPDSAAVAEGRATGPIWTAIAASRGAVRGASATTLGAPPDVSFTLGEVAFPTPGRVAVATGATPAAAAAAAEAAVAEADARLAARQERLAGIVDALGFETGDDATNRAVRWAALSLDALAVRDSSRLYLAPGLPGAAPATFPSVMATMGAWLATGRWDDARALLTTVGDAQRFDQRIDLLGRAPDAVPFGTDPVFATADGTALYLAAAGEYVRATGDRGVVSGGPNFWFKTVFALRGLFQADRRNGTATDTLGFLTTTARRGTWADAGPDGFRRRGSPAEAQGALWQALQAGYQFSEIMGVSGRSAYQTYRDTAAVLVRRVDAAFGREPLLADRVEGVGQAAGGVRPGGLLLLARVPAFPRRAERARALAERLVYPHGVGTLAQTDSLFHPYVEQPGIFTAESARVNGAVATWLAGPVATLMAETGGAAPAAELLAAQATLLLDRGTVGAIPELVAAHPREGGAAPAVGGAPVQPWSLAGYLSGVYEGLLGVRYASPDTLALTPRQPEVWGTTRLRLRLGGGHVRLAVSGTADDATVEVTPEGTLAEGAALRLTAGGATVALPLAEAVGDTATVARDAFTVRLRSGRAEVDGEAVDATSARAPGEAWDGFAFAAPDLRAEYPVMRARASRSALTPAQILRDDLTAGVVLTQTDPDGDDWGATSTFTYPEGVPPGVLDATYLEVARDDSTTYFRAEFNALAEGTPPPTFVAIVLDTGPGGTRLVDRNARYALGPDEGYEYVIFAGDGLLVEDAGGRPLGQLAPGDGSVFDAETGSMAFALPTYVLPRLPRGTRVTMLVGALDPDGVGAFLDVEREAGARAGGGRVDASAPNIYDVIIGRTR